MVKLIGRCNIAIPLMLSVVIGPSFVTVPYTDGTGHGSVSGLAGTA